MFRYLLGCGVIGIALGAAPDARGQLVRIGPLGGVSIRVPFVSVDVSPWGDTRVRAPFTAVDAPGRGYYHHHYHYDQRIPLYDLPAYGYSLPYEAYSSPYEPYSDSYRWYAEPSRRYGLGADPSYALPSRPYRSESPADANAPIEVPYSPYDADWFRSTERASSSDGAVGGDAAGEATAVLRQSLLEAATRLNAALQRRSDGQVWQDYLQPDAIIAAISQGTSADATTDRLRELLDNYDGVTANASLDWVTRLDGFDNTRRLLRQWVSVDDRPPAPGVDRSDAPTPLESEKAAPLESEELPLPPAEAETAKTRQQFEA